MENQNPDYVTIKSPNSTFDGKEGLLLGFNEAYATVEVECKDIVGARLLRVTMPTPCISKNGKPLLGPRDKVA